MGEKEENFHLDISLSSGRFFEESGRFSPWTGSSSFNLLALFEACYFPVL